MRGVTSVLLLTIIIVFSFDHEFIYQALYLSYFIWTCVCWRNVIKDLSVFLSLVLSSIPSDRCRKILLSTLAITLPLENFSRIRGNSGIGSLYILVCCGSY